MTADFDLSHPLTDGTSGIIGETQPGDLRKAPVFAAHRAHAMLKQAFQMLAGHLCEHQIVIVRQYVSQVAVGQFGGRMIASVGAVGTDAAAVDERGIGSRIGLQIGIREKAAEVCLLVAQMRSQGIQFDRRRAKPFVKVGIFG